MTPSKTRTGYSVRRLSSRRGGLVCVMALALLLVGCASSTSPLPQPTASSSPTIVPTATPTLIAPVLADPPTTCRGLPQPQDRWPSVMGPVVGGNPVWTTLPPVVHISPGVSPNGSTGYTSYGWIWKVIWEVGPNYPNPIALRAFRMGDETPLWIDVDGTPTTTPTLDPAHPSHPESKVGDDWREWGSYLYIPTAGCYYLKATWPEGSWETTFAAGR
jgi:hypothetical protein